MRVHWATEIDGVANQLGFSVHNRRAREALAAAGVELAEDAPVALHVASPVMFDPPDDGRLHVVYTAWDSTRLPEAAECLAAADAVICTSSYMVPVLERAARPGTPFFVCPLGVDAEQFAPPGGARRRLRRGERMRVLWIGAPNCRKGYRHALGAFQVMTGAGIGLEWYFKTTTYGEEKRITRQPGSARITFDSRRLERAELARLVRKGQLGGVGGTPLGGRRRDG